MTQKITYKDAGVDYDALDSFKRMAQRAAHETVGNITRLGFRVLEESYGESAFLITPTDDIPYMMALVEEGLGTKNLVADAMYRLTGKSYYDQISQDAVAMIVNDMITLGALPLAVEMHLAVGDSRWFEDERRSGDLISGWKRTCDEARCVWGGGETPTLKDVVAPDTVVLSGSATGAVKPKERLIRIVNIRDGDQIVLIRSSGMHANGYTLAREIASRLPQGYLTPLANGRAYGEALLDPTIIYVALVEELVKAGIDIHYAVNITGHGWRKLMRATQSFTYIIERMPTPQPVFGFIQERGPVDEKEMYANFNMGAGFAFYVPQHHAEDAVKIALMLGYEAMRAGYIEKSKEKKVIIKPKGIEFTSLWVR